MQTRAEQYRKESLRRTLKEVVKTVRIQRRHFFFWLFIVLFASGLFYFIQHANYLFASVPEIEENVDFSNPVYTIPVTVSASGEVLINEQPTYKVLRPQPHFDEFSYKVLDKPNIFIDEVTVRVRFATPVPKEAKLRSFAVHGIEKATEQLIDENTIEYTAYGIGPGAVYTITAELPPGTIHWPIWRRVAVWLASVPVRVWLYAAIGLPLLTVIVLLTMFASSIRHFLRGRPKNRLSVPPQPLPPAVAGVLIHGRISAREIAATILDLANRGYLTIYNRDNGQFTFAKRRPWDGLKSFELELMTQLFKGKELKSTNQDIEISLGETLFSPDIARVYLAIYDEATRYRYFVDNPGAIHQRFRLIGLLLFFATLAAFVAAIVFQVQPTYLLFILAGVMTMSLVIIVSADAVPLLTKEGEKARQQWLAFDNTLAAADPVGYIEGAKDYYEKFLPYAIVMSRETEWARRFRDHPFGVPDWYASTADNLAIEDFANGLHKIVGMIGELFASAKEPTVS